MLEKDGPHELKNKVEFVVFPPALFFESIDFIGLGMLVLVVGRGGKAHVLADDAHGEADGLVEFAGAEGEGYFGASAGVGVCASTGLPFEMLVFSPYIR